MRIKPPKYESHVTTITPVVAALSHGEKVRYHHRELGKFGRFVNKISPGTFPEVITTATIEDSHIKHYIKPLGGKRRAAGMDIISIEGVRFAYTDTPLPSPDTAQGQQDTESD